MRRSPYYPSAVSGGRREKPFFLLPHSSSALWGRRLVGEAVVKSPDPSFVSTPAPDNLEVISPVAPSPLPVRHDRYLARYLYTM